VAESHTGTGHVIRIENVEDLDGGQPPSHRFENDCSLYISCELSDSDEIWCAAANSRMVT